MSEQDVLFIHHKFIRDEDSDKIADQSWGVRLAKKYYESLYKDFALVDLSQYKTAVGMRWPVENEVLKGKGQTMCGEVSCCSIDDLTVLEVPFSYRDFGDNENKLELVKVVVCSYCREKLNYLPKKLSRKHKKER